jgi:hypothetical protein
MKSTVGIAVVIRSAVQLLLALGVMAGTQPGAEQVASTAQGRKVLLKDDGTWRFLSEQEAQQVQSTAVADRPGQASAVQPKIAVGSLINFVVKDDSTDFRNARWGMSPAQVKAGEKSQLVSEGRDTLVYKAVLSELACSIVYVFTTGGLAAASYIVEQPHADPARFLKDYENLKAYLQPIYGQMISEQNLWKNDMYKDNPEAWGFAISIGFLNRKAVWKGKRSRIELFLSGINHEISTRIDFFKP